MLQTLKNRLFLLFGIALYMASTNSAMATVVVVDPLEVMAQQSEVIIHGVVFEQDVRQDDNGRIITLTTVEIIDGIKGATKGERVTIYQVGGTINGISQWIAGNHRFVQDEEFLLFGVRHEDMIVSYGVGIGKFRIVRDASGTVLVEDVNNVLAAYRQQNGQMKFEEAMPRVFLTLDAFKEMLRNVGDIAAPQKVKKPQLRAIKPRQPKMFKQPSVPKQPTMLK